MLIYKKTLRNSVSLKLSILSIFMQIIHLFLDYVLTEIVTLL